MSNADENFFLFSGPIWFVGAFPRHERLEDSLAAAVRVNVDGGDDPSTGVTAVFSDLDLAERCVKDMERYRPEQAGRLKPFTAANPEELANFLEILAAQGHSHIAVDPGAIRTRMLKITEIIYGIRNRRRKKR